VGSANAEQLGDLFSEIRERLPHVEVGVHLHAKPNEWLAKVEAAYNHGCRRFDAALGGFGGCPMAKDDLVGNIPSEGAFSWLSQQEPAGLTMKIQWDELRSLAQKTYEFGTY
jgi:hydroxymethylglutaryl-CoA lyase